MTRVTVERSRHMTFPREKAVGIIVRFGLVGIGVYEERYALDSVRDVRCWRANNRVPNMQLGITEIKHELDRRAYVLHERARRKAWSQALKTPISIGSA